LAVFFAPHGMALRVAAINFKTSSNRVELLARAAQLIEAAATQHSAQLVVLPEAFTGLYGVKYFASNAEVWKAKHSGTQLMAQMAAKHHIHVVGGVIEQHPINKKMFNTVAAFGPNGEVARYRKIHLSKVTIGPDSTSEGTILESGDELSWFDIADSGDGSDGRGWRIGIACCFDLRFRDLSDMLVKAPPKGVGADVLLYPSSWLKSTGDLGHWDTLLKARALDGQCYVVGVSNAQDDEQDCVAYGHSQIIDPLGRVMNVCENHCEDEIVVSEMTMKQMIKVRNHLIPLESCKRPIIYEDALRSVQSMPSAMMRPPTGTDSKN
jgi:predicted amidohydrolase